MGAITKIELPRTLGEEGTEGFLEILKREILALPPDSLPLQLAASQGGIIQEGIRDATVLGIDREGTSFTARVGIFFTEVVGGCSCGDEPFTTDGYCELFIRIQEGSREAEVGLA